jgi:hypothetical protein
VRPRRRGSAGNSHTYDTNRHQSEYQQPWNYEIVDHGSDVVHVVYQVGGIAIKVMSFSPKGSRTKKDSAKRTPRGVPVNVTATQVMTHYELGKRRNSR